jgi:hypothetical protein
MLVAIARNSLIVLAILISPFYVLWIAGGAIADKIERRKHPFRIH